MAWDPFSIFVPDALGEQVCSRTFLESDDDRYCPDCLHGIGSHMRFDEYGDACMYCLIAAYTITHDEGTVDDACSHTNVRGMREGMAVRESASRGTHPQSVQTLP